MPPRSAVVLVVVAQVALPLTMLVQRWADEGSRPVTERPASWQMYSSTDAPVYTGVLASGAERELTLEALPRVLRAVGTGALVPHRLCAADRSLRLVRRTGGPDPVEVAC